MPSYPNSDIDPMFFPSFFLSCLRCCASMPLIKIYTGVYDSTDANFSSFKI